MVSAANNKQGLQFLSLHHCNGTMMAMFIIFVMTMIVVNLNICKNLISLSVDKSGRVLVCSFLLTGKNKSRSNSRKNCIQTKRCAILCIANSAFPVKLFPHRKMPILVCVRFTHPTQCRFKFTASVAILQYDSSMRGLIVNPQDGFLLMLMVAVVAHRRS